MSKTCPSCGSPLNDDDKFCSNCKTKLEDKSKEISKKSPKVFIILGIVALSIIVICIIVGIFVALSVNTLGNNLLDDSEAEISQARTEIITETSEETTIASQTEDTKSNNEEKETYLSAKKKAEKDNSEINVTYCSEIKAFLDGEDVLSNANMIYDYGNITFYTLYPHTLSFVNEIDEGIFCGLNIGMPYSQINTVLGEPNGHGYSDNTCIYYFDGYSVAFYGEDNIDCIGIIKMPQLDENYKNIVDDAIKLIKEAGSEVPLDYDPQVYDKLEEKYHDYILYANGSQWVMHYFNGFSIHNYYISICPSYYGSFDYFDNTDENLEIYWNTHDGELCIFEDFCERYFSDEWIDSPNKTYSAYLDTLGPAYNIRIHVRSIPDNQFKTMRIDEGNDLKWISDKHLIYNSNFHGPYILNVESWNSNPIDVNHQDNSEMTYSIDTDGNIVTTDENDKKTVYSVEDIIKEFGT